MKNKSIIIIWISSIILLFTFCISFINSNNKETRKPLKTSLLNPKNITKVNEFYIGDANREVYLVKNYFGIWEITNNSFGKINCDSNKVTTFIQDLSNIINIYKISEKNNSSSYGLEGKSKNTVYLSYTLDDGNKTNLTFGNYDFSEKYRYFSNDGNSVYEISNVIDKYLTTAVQSWAEPEILGKSVLNSRTYKDIQTIYLQSEFNTKRLYNSDSQEFNDYVLSLTELRHGGFPSSEQQEDKPETSIILEFGDKTELQMNIYATNDQNEFILKLNYDDTVNKTVINNTMKISNWTYSKIKTSKL